MARDGYLVARNFFPPEQIEEVLGWTADLAAAHPAG